MAVTSLGVIGAASASGTDTVVIPIVASIPRSDPDDGATLIVVTVISDDGAIGQLIAAISDDGETDPFYGDCLITSGLNSYVESPIGVNASSVNLTVATSWIGLITNPLDASNSITVTLTGTQDFIFAFATAYTGCNVDYTGVGGFTDASFMFSSPGSPTNPCGTVTCGATDQNLAWQLFAGVNISNPSGCSGPTDWQWDTGDLALYWLIRLNPATPTGGNTWTDGSIESIAEFDDTVTGVDSDTFSFVFAEQPVSTPVSGIDVSSTWAAPIDNDSTFGGGGVLIGGFGPLCTETPPPGSGMPILHTQIRLSE